MTIVRRMAAGIQSLVSLLLLLGFVAGITAIRSAAVSGATPQPEALREQAADSLEAALAPGGSGISFDVVQVSTLHAKADGPRIELHDPLDPTKVTGVVDEYEIGTVLSRGSATGEAFWMDVSIARDGNTEFDTAELFARVIERDGNLWRDDGRGWYLTDESPGVGMDPVTARSLAGALRSLTDVEATESVSIAGRIVAGISGTSTPEAYPGVIAADGAAFTEKTFGIQCQFDDQGRLVRLQAAARNLNQETYDLIVATTVSISYGSPGDPPEPTPTMAPEVLPTSEPEAAEVKP